MIFLPKKLFDELTGSELKFLFYTGFCVLFLCIEAAISKAAVHSIFLHHFGALNYPYIWIFSIFINSVSVLLYNKFLPKIGCLGVVGIVIGITIILEVFGIFFLVSSRSLSFFHILWREVYMVILLQQLWSNVHYFLRLKHAKFLYGILFCIGSFGSTLGSFIVSKSSTQIGSEYLFLFCVPSLFACIILFRLMFKISKVDSDQLLITQKGNFSTGYKIISNNSFLIFLLLTVVLTQIGSSIINYQFNFLLEKKFSDIDTRTEFIGRITSIFNLLSFILELVGSYVFIELLGAKKIYQFISIILILNSIIMILNPTLIIFAYAHVTIKTFERSTFNIIKELLYVPLKTVEKFHAKAFIDVLGYRFAKVFSAFLLIIIPKLLPNEFIYAISISALIVFIIWFSLLNKMFNTYEKILKNQKDDKQIDTI
ncbi:MAG: hypothetical protein ACRYE9_01640 [Janthinobacterium lividum]